MNVCVNVYSDLDIDIFDMKIARLVWAYFAAQVFCRPAPVTA